MAEAHVIYCLAWFSFGLGHSILASRKTKTWLEIKLGAYYRITYNAVASAHIIAVWLVGIYLFDGATPFNLPEAAQTSMLGVSLVGVLILLIALKGYDLGLLAGTKQIRNSKMGITEPSDEPLQTAGLHCYVRHPLYLGAYLILFGLIQDDRGLASAIWGSLYLFIGTIFEERNLIKIYGDAYKTYRQKVPSIIPWRGKAY